uniref:G-patch domain-containing protein n=1 Tax=Polytomella parva TaxID=51329 RepID=A0A7S0UM18_9CHLO|mmetsp:Transcript_10671/g.19490  ORF Transcript_10671/g.19490 Transcript_10671/m.19490 type:complete len:243 (+) Transcript_10671:237-965(+)|eukprot:CAMPEP_0175040952 /NCGR_PEP_ID=MMETSP0052_2-20121109/1605_1 /TAXON_ID=51329 ORGANISM="Polytomella parva, Strain SAG 63-3" /NCGR_SAMPLE_ID=MMETSP0052_2 /ASSEMBLY_ACC=CAM_ASM_000194 /LENGTH=242 /DNA_ID=CAMNT_0016303333 /DNA_START=162 /DNA_END=890 /DNA_ORIENTATION=-
MGTSKEEVAKQAFVSSGFHDLSDLNYFSRDSSQSLTKNTSENNHIHPGSSSHARRQVTPRLYQNERTEEAKPLGSMIGNDNIGFKLLVKAGWKEGKGLGADEQGRIAPLGPEFRFRQQGLGFDTLDPKSHSIKPSSESKPELNSTSSNGHDSDMRQQKKTSIADIVQDELDSESLHQKVKRHKQIMRQEEDDHKRRLIASYLSRSFSEPYSDNTSSANLPPKHGASRISSLNPLIDDGYVFD